MNHMNIMQMSYIMMQNINGIIVRANIYIPEGRMKI